MAAFVTPWLKVIGYRDRLEPEIFRELGKVDQLTRGGRLVAPVGGKVYEQELVVVDKSGTGEIHRRAVAPVRFVPMVPE